MATNNKPAANNAANEFNWQNYIKECRRHWWWFVISVVVVCGLGLTYTQLKNPRYQVDANVLIADESGEGGSLSLMKQFDISSMLGGTGSVDNEMAIMGSHAVMMATVQELNLNCTYHIKTGFLKTLTAWTDAPVQLTYDKALTDSLKAGILIKLTSTPEGIADIKIKYGKENICNEKGVKLPYTFKMPFGDFTLEKTSFFPLYTAKGDDVKETIVLADYSSTAEDYQTLIKIAEINKKADIVSLSMISNNPVFAKKIINTVVANYNQSGINQQRIKGQNTVKFLDERIVELFSQLQSQEKTLEKFKRDRNLSHVEADAGLAIERSAAYQERLIEAELGLEMMKLVKGFITNPANNKSFIPSVGAASGTAVQDAISGYNGLIMQRMQLTQAAKSDNVALQQLDLNIDAMRTNINITLDRSIETAEAQLAELRRETGRAKNITGMIPQTEREYLEIERNQQVLQKLYLYLLQQREEKALSVANLQPRGVIIDEAYILSKPLKLSPMKASAIFLILGLLIPAGILFLLERMRKNVCNISEAKAICAALPVLAESNNDSWNNELASSVKYMLGANNGKCVLVTSPESDDNNSITSIKLAAALAVNNTKVLLIDADFRSQYISKHYNINTQSGLTEYLGGMCTVNDIIHPSATIGSKNIDLITSGGKAPNTAELLTSDKMKTLMEQATNRYEYIILDTAGIADSAESGINASYATSTVLVVSESHTSLAALKKSEEKIHTGLYHNTGIMYFHA